MKLEVILKLLELTKRKTKQWLNQYKSSCLQK